MRSAWEPVLLAPVVAAAPSLLGATLTSSFGGERVTVRLVEVEAYSGVGDDPGSHAHRGRTRRNATMFGPPGRAYVYFTYGMHWCMNVVCGPPGRASAVLLRAGEVVEGIEVARRRRPRASNRDLARGPARLTMALGVDGTLDGVDLLEPSSVLHLSRGSDADPRSIRIGPRVGVGGDAAATPWRFWLDGEPTVSAYRAAVVRRRGGSRPPSEAGASRSTA